MRHAVSFVAALALAAGAFTAAAVAKAPSAAIAAAVADPARPAADTARDAERKPAQIIAFAGVKPGDTVIELMPGGGYFTRMLSKTVGPKGHVYGLVPEGFTKRPGALDGLNALAAQYGNVTIMPVDLASFKVPAPADVVWTSENYHDFHNGPTADIAALDKAVFNNLKPGGIFYVEDHSAAPGAGLAATSQFHRMDEAVAKSELTAAGFKLDGEGELLRNPADNKAASNSETGHFASDRFMLRMKRP